MMTPMKPFAAIIAMLFAILVASAADPSIQPFRPLEPKPLTPGHQVVLIFPPGHPALRPLAGSDQEEKFTLQNDRVARVINVHNPSIELYLAPPEKANGMSVILSPGGGNVDLWVGPEGTDVAKWLNGFGISCFVHRYRLQPYAAATDTLLETQRAVRIVRAHAREWNIDPSKIGHMGFSAGGQQTARLALTFDAGNPAAADPIDRVSSRPDWICLVYPGWATGTLDLAHVPKDVPPAFLVCAGTGDIDHAQKTVAFYNALFETGRNQKPKPLNIEMHIYGSGGHGGAISRRNGIPFGSWQQRFIEWAVDLTLMPAPTKRDPGTGGYVGEEVVSP